MFVSIQYCKIEKVLSEVPVNVSFRRQLTGNNLIHWYTLVQRIMHVRLNTNKDVFLWNLHQHENFSVHSMYLALITMGRLLGTP
jgi:hypothetical protein